MDAVIHSGQVHISAGSPGNTSRGQAVLNALTVDLEEYFQVSAFDGLIRREDWQFFASRIASPTEKLLRIFAEFNVKATFFVVAWLARQQPDLIRQIHAAGHEIGSHSTWHRLVYELSPEEFRKDLRESVAILSDIIGSPITSFRAPSFSITPRSQWAFEILIEEGIRHDSSVFPIRHDRYGWPTAQIIPFQVHTGSGMLWEFPGTAVRFLGLSIPLGGGGYFRLYPYLVTAALCKKVNRAGRPVLCYIHPWELDPDQPRMPGINRLTRFRHYVNLASTDKKLLRLLRQFRWGPLEDVLRSWASRESNLIKLTPELMPLG